MGVCLTPTLLVSFHCSFSFFYTITCVFCFICIHLYFVLLWSNCIYYHPSSINNNLLWFLDELTCSSFCSLPFFTYKLHSPSLSKPRHALVWLNYNDRLFFIVFFVTYFEVNAPQYHRLRYIIISAFFVASILLEFECNFIYHYLDG